MAAAWRTLLDLGLVANYRDNRKQSGHPGATLRERQSGATPPSVAVIGPSPEFVQREERAELDCRRLAKLHRRERLDGPAQVEQLMADESQAGGGKAVGRNSTVVTK